MKTSEMLRERYNELIEAMKKVDRQAIENPHLQFDVIISEDGEIDIFEDIAGSNSWRPNWITVASFSCHNHPVEDWDEREADIIFKEDLFPRLTLEHQEEVKNYIHSIVTEEEPDDEHWFYWEMMMYIKGINKYQYAWDGYTEDMIDNYFSNVSEDYYTDRLNYRILEYEDMESLYD